MATTRRLQVEVVANASGFLATMNRMNSGVTNTSRGLLGMNRNLHQSNRYLQAIGTTTRYMIAGRLIFGVQNAIRNLGQFKTQLGEIDALATRVNSHGQMQGLGNQLADVGKQALLMSNQFGISVTEVETYMQRFYTAFKPKGTQVQQTAQMEQFVRAHLNLVTLLGSRAGDPNALAGGLAALVPKVPGGKRNPGGAAETLSNYFAKIILSSPTLQGQDIASGAGRLASVITLSGMSVKDVLAAFGLAAHTGGSSAVIIRGMTQLLGTSLMHPTRPQSKAVYSSAGLPTDPNALHALGGEKVLETLIKFVNPSGAKGGVSKLNLDAIYNAFSRQESVRQFVNMIANGGVPALKAFQKELEAAAKQSMAQRRADIRLKQSILVRMTNASTKLGIGLVAGGDWPLENLIARPLIATSNAAIRHPKVTQAVIGSALTLGAANALRKLGAGRLLGGRFGRLGGAVGALSAVEGAAISGAITKSELPAAIAGTGDGSRSSPFWVIISPLSWSLGTPGGAFGPKDPKTPAPGGHSFPTVITKFGKRYALPVARVAGPLGIGIGAYELLGQQGTAATNLWSQIQTDRGSPLHGSGAMSAMMAALAATHVSAKNIAHVDITGNAKADIMVHLVDKNGNEVTVVEKRGVPISMFPTAQGKPGARKAIKHG